MYNIEMKQWANEFFKLKQHEMSIELMRLWVDLYFMDKERAELREEITKTRLYLLIKSRAEYLKLEMSNGAYVILMYLSPNPGIAVMYLSALKVKQSRSNREINIEYLSELFPNGFPSETDLSLVWAKQKINGHNLLDLVNPDTDFI